MSGKISQEEKCVVGIDHPYSDTLLATLQIEDTSLSTSGTYKRNWKIAKNKYHHIINPYSSKTPEEVVSLSIIASDCTTTDALATACIAMGLS